MEIFVGDRGKIEEKISTRDPIVRTFPEEWKDKRFSGLVPGQNHGLRNTTQPVRGISTFGSVPMEVELQPYEEDRDPLWIVNGNKIPMRLENVRKGLIHSIAFREGRHSIDIIEHVGSLIGVFRLQVDVIITSGKSLFGFSSMPSLPECNGAFIDGIDEAGIYPLDLAESMTVAEPVLITFPNGGYLIFEPPNPETQDELVLDHQIHYPHKPIGRQRVIYPLRPDSYAFLARARPLAVGIAVEVMSVLEKSPYLGFDRNNAVYVDHEEIVNPREMFEHDGRNLEPMCHEFIDRTLPPTLLEQSCGGRLVGTWTTYRVGHKQEMQAIEAMLKDGSGVRFVRHR